MNRHIANSAKGCWQSLRRARTAASCLVLLAVLLRPEAVRACAACYGASDSPLAAGMNWGILSLLAIVGCVLGSVGMFFVFIAKKSAAVAAEELPAAPPQPSDPQAKP